MRHRITYRDKPAGAHDHDVVPGFSPVTWGDLKGRDMNSHIAIEIKAATRSADNSGMRLGWLVYAPDGDLEGFVDAGQAGHQELYQWFPRSSVTVLASLRVTPAEWRDSKHYQVRR